MPSSRSLARLVRKNRAQRWLDVTVAYAERHGYRLDAGGWVYRGRDRPLSAQGWYRFSAQMRPVILDELSRDLVGMDFATLLVVDPAPLLDARRDWRAIVLAEEYNHAQHLRRDARRARTVGIRIVDDALVVDRPPRLRRQAAPAQTDS